MTAPRPMAVVTGAGQRLGLTIAEDLVSLGWEVVPVVRSVKPATPARPREGAGRLLDAVERDLRDPAVWFDLWPALRARYGRMPTALVHAASIFEQDTPENAPWAAVDAHRRVNSDAFIAAATAWSQTAGRDDRGSFVALLDQKVTRLNPDHYAYTLSKLQLHASIPFLAQTLAPRLRVNAVSPGLTLPSGGQSPAAFESVRAGFPLQGGPAPRDIAAAVVFLLTQPWITGQNVTVDGGQHLQSDRDAVFSGPA